MTLLTRTLLLLALALLPTVGLQVHQNWTLRQVAHEAAEAQALRVLGLVEAELARVIEGARQVLMVTSQIGAVRDGRVAECQAMMRRLAPLLPESQALNVTDGDDRIICSTSPPAIGLWIGDRVNVIDARAAGGFVVGDFVLRRSTGEKVIAVAAPLDAAPGRAAGVVTMTLRLDGFEAQLAHILPAGWNVMVADRNGRLLARLPADAGPLGAQLVEPYRPLLGATGRGVAELDETGEAGRLVAYSPLGLAVPGMFVSVGMPRGEVLSLLSDSSGREAALVLATLLIAAAAAWSAYRRLIARPLAGLMTVAERWQEGDYAARLALADGTPELVGLSRALDGVAAAAAERQGARRALEESEERLAFALEAAQAGFWVWEPPCDRVIWSQGMAGLFGHDLGAALTLRCWLDLVDGDDRAAIEARIGEIFAARRRDFRLEYRIRHPGRGYRWLADIGRVSYDQDGAPLRAAGFCFDITELKRTEQAMQRAKLEAERATLAKSRFLAAASHDLRQPFQAMRLFYGVLSQQLTPAQLPSADKMDEAMRAGEQLLAAILDVSILDAGTARCRIESFAVAEVLAQVAAECEPQAKAVGLRLAYVPSSARVRSDPVLLARMVRNLVLNAIRYTERGGVLVGCRAAGGMVRIEVWDSGVGLAADKLELIFEDFYRVEEGPRPRAGGLGLGLAVVARMSRLLDHPVAVRSVPGRGSVFALTLPRAGAAETAAPPATSAGAMA